MTEPASSQNSEPNDEAAYLDTVHAEFRLPTEDLKKDLPFFSKTLGFRLETIFPADNPAVAVMSGHGLRLRLERGAREAPGTIRLLCRDPAAFADGRTELIAPNGTRIEIVDARPPLEMPQTRHSFVVRKLENSDSWIVGRAGMHYRDLIPGRLGGRIIASHIRIPGGGAVPDMVHYHSIGFQLIFCYRGWVKVVYEDQGPPFILRAGDCFLQPPDRYSLHLRFGGNHDLAGPGPRFPGPDRRRCLRDSARYRDGLYELLARPGIARGRTAGVLRNHRP
jgi:hypothetical protein